MLYKITIKPYSSFNSNLQSDTLFGAFCWSYKYLYGEAKLNEFLDLCLNKKPQVIFSNAFLKDTLPIPIKLLDEKFACDEFDSFSEKVKKYNNHKKLKQYSLITKDCFLKVLKKDYSTLYESLVYDKIYNSTQIRNLVNRSNNTVTNIDDNPSLFVENDYFIDGSFDIYLLSELDFNVLENVINLMFKLGIGANKSSGKGGFYVLEFKKEDKLNLKLENANGFVSLSNFIPKQNDPTNGYYNLINKFPKLDREFSSSKTPFKKPVRMIKAGSCFYDDKIESYYGKCINNISLLSENIVMNACTISVPIIL